MSTLIIHDLSSNAGKAHKINAIVGGHITRHSAFQRIAVNSAMTNEQVANWRREFDCDLNVIPVNFDPSRVRLVVSDMDSTLINIECIDEIADFAGVKPQVSAITEAAMRGELDFAQSLTRRVALLKGLPESVLERVYVERLKLNPGAEKLLAGLRRKGIRFALVSGGFTFFTERLRARLGLDYTLANTLEIEDGKLTGKVVGSIVGAEAKAGFLLQLCEEIGAEPAQAVAMGDGANDLKMMAVAGMGVAYRAKPKVQEQAHCAINHGELDAILGLLGLDA